MGSIATQPIDSAMARRGDELLTSGPGDLRPLVRNRSVTVTVV